MTKMNGLELAADVSLARRDAAARVLGQSQQGWAGAKMQYDQLETYAQECTARWAKQSLSCTPDLMRHHYSFMARLEHAIALQKRVVDDHAARVERDARLLRDAEARLESLKQLVAARVRERQTLLDRREQKLCDEQAAIQHRRRSGEAFSESF